MKLGVAGPWMNLNEAAKFCQKMFLNDWVMSSYLDNSITLSDIVFTKFVQFV